MSKYFDYFTSKALNPIGDSDSHFVTLHSLVLSSMAKNVLELGVRNGDTTLPFLSAVKLTGGILNSVDLEPTSYEPPADLAEHWNFHQMDAIQYLKNLNTILDIVFIDNWHNGNHVLNEINLIEPFITKKSLILMHDCMHTWSHPEYQLFPPSYPGGDYLFGDGGPYGALLKLKMRPGGNNWEFSTIPYCNGLTILRKIN